MSRSMMAAIAAAAAGLDPVTGSARVSPAATAPQIPDTSDEAKFAMYVLQSWKSSAAIQAQFRGDVVAYSDWLQSKHGKNGSGTLNYQAPAMSAFIGNEPDVASYISKLEQKCAVPAEERMAIAVYAQDWKNDPQAWADFPTFDRYATYRRAVAAGRVRQHGPAFRK